MSRIENHLAAMSLVAALIVPACVPISAQTAKAKTEVVANGEPMASALKKVERMTGYRIMFAYDDVKMMKSQGKVSTKDIKKALAQVIGKQPLTYTVEGHFVTVKVKEEDLSNVSTSQ